MAFEEGCIVWLPDVGLLPPHDPEAEHELAWLLVQERTVLCPCSILVELRLMDKAGAGAGGGVFAVTAIEAVRVMLPPAPMQVSV